MNFIYKNVNYSFDILWEHDFILMGVDQSKQTILYWNNEFRNEKYDEYSLIYIPDVNILNLFLSNKLPSIDLFSLDTIEKIGITFDGEIFKTSFNFSKPDKDRFNAFINKKISKINRLFILRFVFLSDIEDEIGSLNISKNIFGFAKIEQINDVSFLKIQEINDNLDEILEKVKLF